jgi:large subunit ribosomal protein L23
MSIKAEHYDVLRSPLLSEKSTRLQAENCYVFKVAADATKLQIRDAVQAIFSVTVEAVNVVNLKGKQKNFRFRSGMRQGSRKAYVKLKAGDSIDLSLKA